MRRVAARRGWVFDLDGTLTVARHDFRAARAELGLPPSGDLISQLDAHPESARLWAWVEAWEREIAAGAQASSDALGLVRALHARGAQLGVLTRNSRENAIFTLQVTGLDRFFPAGSVIGRSCARPKPAPDGVRAHLQRWGLAADQAVMVGDFTDDVLAGRAAGVATVLVDRRGRFPADRLADWRVESLGEVRAWV
jgi:HAD superfamily hydrolase (TIGR01509 family)